MKKQIIPDTDFGQIILLVRSTARNISMRPQAEALYVTVPPYRTLASVLEAIEPYRKRLLKLKEDMHSNLFSSDFCVDADCFKFYLEAYDGCCLKMEEMDGKVCLRYPHLTEFSLESTQQAIRLAVECALKKKAMEYLPQLLHCWSVRVGLPYEGVRITKARTRWGSCSSQKRISLSFYLMLLPAHLIDYVILHELAHTREMNHGVRFWNLLQSLTEGKAINLRNELKRFRPAF